MALATHLGPWRLGTVRFTTGTTAGTVANIGLTLVTQTYNVGFATVTTAPTAVLMFCIPAGSKIVRFNYENTTAFAGNGVTAIGVQIGDGTTANKYQASVSTGITAAKLSTATADAGLVPAQTNNVGTADILLYGTFTATTGNPTSGAQVVTVEYIVRNADGTGQAIPYNQN